MIVVAQHDDTLEGFTHLHSRTGHDKQLIPMVVSLFELQESTDSLPIGCLVAKWGFTPLLLDLHLPQWSVRLSTHS